MAYCLVIDRRRNFGPKRCWISLPSRQGLMFVRLEGMPRLRKVIFAAVVVRVIRIVIKLCAWLMGSGGRCNSTHESRLMI